MSLNVPQSIFDDFLPLEGAPTQWDAGPGGDAMVTEERSSLQPLFVLPSLFMAGLSALAGGIPLLTDCAFILLTVFCSLCLIAELKAFSFRWGIGGLLVHGGVIIWFCYDYLKVWAGASLTGGAMFDIFSKETIARAGAFHILFVVMMLLGLRIRLGGAPERFIAKYPEPGSDRMYMVLVGSLFLFGMSPYFLFTNENPFMAIYHDIMGGRAGGALWSVGRDGNINYSYGAYLAQVLQVGSFASILGAFYAVCVTRSWFGRIFGLAVWLPAVALGFGTGARGALVFVTIPMMGFLFIRFQAEAAARQKRVSLQAYAWLAVALFVILLLVQVQITFRNSGFAEADLNAVQISDVQGNSMFSESLKGYELIPAMVEPFYARNPIEAIVRPLPEVLFWGVVTPMPRAIWTTKPIDEVWQWYNLVVAGTRGTEGTTVSHGMTGYWYFRYGFVGILEGGLFMGYLMGMTERLLRNYSPEKPILIVVSLAIATWLFRCYRGLQWMEFHGSLVGLTALAIAIVMLRPLVGGQNIQRQE